MKLASHRLHRRPWAVAASAAVLLLAGCAAGPDYVRPAPDEMPSAFKEAPPAPWKSAEPQAIDAGHPWWSLYGDPVLAGLVEQARQANQDLRAADAAYRQARALADEARAGYYPTVGASGGVQRARTNTNGVKVGNAVTLGLDASWEPDLWGGVRRSVEAGEASAQASAADLAAAQLSIETTLAQDYFQLRAIDLQSDLYVRTVDAYRKSLELTQHQYAAGVVLRSDVALADTQLQTADAERIDLLAQRAQFEHAIAVLVGKPPASFSIAPLPSLQATLPAIPVGMPSDLLQRRPDIAGAERRAAAANAQIGVVRAAYFPSLTLSASGGFSGGDFAHLFDVPSRVWSLGAGLAGALFDGGLRRARDAQAVAAYDGTVAQYKQTVLGGFQEVEDGLATLRVLDDESQVQDKAVQASALSERLALSQYRAGTATYLSVITAQTLSLGNQRTAVQLLGRRLVASVGLIKATGGGWNAAALDAAPVAQAR